MPGAIDYTNPPVPATPGRTTPVTACTSISGSVSCKGCLSGDMLLGNQRRVVTISGMVTVAEPVPLLLERDAELARLSALLEQAHAGSGAVVTISGPAGIGKTQLLAAVHRLAGDRGFRSLRARGRELEADMAFSVVRQLLEQPVLSASAAERRRLLAGRPGPVQAHWGWPLGIRPPLTSRRCTGCTGCARTSRSASRCC